MTFIGSVTKDDFDEDAHLFSLVKAFSYRTLTLKKKKDSDTG